MSEFKMIYQGIVSHALILILSMSFISSVEDSDSSVSKQVAIDVAFDVVSSSRSEISGAQEKPSNIQAEQMTLDEAVKKIDKNNQPMTGYDSNSIVWFITMDGLWLNEMDAP